MTNSDISFLTELETIIQQRLNEGTEESYTARLVASGDKRVAQKVGEEAVELALAAISGDRQEQLAGLAEFQGTFSYRRLGSAKATTHHQLTWNLLLSATCACNA